MKTRKLGVWTVTTDTSHSRDWCHIHQQRERRRWIRRQTFAAWLMHDPDRLVAAGLIVIWLCWMGFA